MSKDLVVMAAQNDPATMIGGYRPGKGKTWIDRNGAYGEPGRVYFAFNGNQPGVPAALNANRSELRVMSYLFEDEWKDVEREVIEASQYPLRVVDDVKSAGLNKSVDPNVLVSQWYTQGEITGATVNMLGRSMADRDLPETRPTGVPIPMIYKDLSMSSRAIGASRRIGDGIDLTMVTLATRVVAEKLEDLLINGDTSISYAGNTLYGLLTEPNVTTDTAASFGGGDFGTPGNPEKTIAGMINSLNAANYRGPFTVYVSETQFNQMAMTYHTDGSAQTALQRINTWPSVRSVMSLPSTSLAAGSVIVAQFTRDVVEWGEGAGIQVREWQSGNGMEVFFRIMAIGGPRIKARQNGESGIRVATGA